MWLVAVDKKVPSELRFSIDEWNVESRDGVCTWSVSVRCNFLSRSSVFVVSRRRKWVSLQCSGVHTDTWMLTSAIATNWRLKIHFNQAKGSTGRKCFSLWCSCIFSRVSIICLYRSTCIRNHAVYLLKEKKKSSDRSPCRIVNIFAVIVVNILHLT